MKFESLLINIEETDVAALKEEYKAGHQIGKITLGEKHFFFKKKMKAIYLPFENIYRVFRRVQLVNMKMCCSRGQLQIQNIVLCSKKNDELAMIDLPDEKAALALIEEMQKKLPELKVGMKK